MSGKNGEPLKIVWEDWGLQERNSKDRCDGDNENVICESGRRPRFCESQNLAIFIADLGIQSKRSCILIIH